MKSYFAGRATATNSKSDFWQGNAHLPLIFSASIPVRGFAYLIGLKENQLRHAFVGAYLRWQRRGVGKFQRHIAFSFRLKRRDVENDAQRA